MRNKKLTRISSKKKGECEITGDELKDVPILEGDVHFDFRDGDKVILFKNAIIEGELP